MPPDLARLAPAAVYTARTGADGEWLHVSPQIEAILGYTPEEFVTEPGLWARLLHPEDREWVLAEEQATLFGEVDRSYAEYRLLARDGRVVWVLDDVTILPDSTYGSVQHGLLFDISQRKHAELLMTEQAALLGRIARGDSVEVVLAELARSVRTVSGARSCTVLLAPVPAPPTGPRPNEDVAAGADTSADTGAAGRRTVDDLTFHDELGGLLGRLSVTGLPDGSGLRHEAGRPDLEWALRLATLAVGRARQEEREARSYSLLRATLESTADGILVVDPNGRIAGHNQKFREMWEIPQELLDACDDDRVLEYVMSQLVDREAFVAEVRRLYASPERSSLDELRFLDGRVFERFSQPQWLDGRSVGRVWSFRDVTDYRRLESELRRQAHTDALTGLPNRHMFMERLTELARPAGDGSSAVSRTGLLLIDVDDFKTVNDGLGHVAGDAMLVALGERMRACVRGSDIAARLGGDEFAVLLSEPADPEHARAVAERIVSVLAEPIDLEGRQLSIRVSVGIALSAEGTAPGELVRNADLAMYSAKRDGGAGYRFYELSMHSEAIARLNLQADLRRAIDEDGLWVAYQPIVCLRTGRVLGVEALARWTHPELGEIQPVEFIPLAEETGLIGRLGRWVLARACADVARWKSSSNGMDLSLSVNLSPQQLSDPAFIAQVTAILARTGLSPHDLCLEITESALIQPHLEVQPLLRDISALGIRLALDDFGTGHSSLTRLGTYPFDVVKVDRSFVSGIVEGSTDRAVVEAVLRIAEAFGLEVVAEGIETAEQLAAILEMGCERGQGFWFSRPVAADEVLRLLRPDSRTAAAEG